MKWPAFFVFTALLCGGTIGCAETIVTFDELPFQSVDGLLFSRVQFAFLVDGVPSNDAYFASFGPGALTHVTDPSLTGNSVGILSFVFDVPTRVIAFGAALNTASDLTSGLTVALFDASLRPLGVSPVHFTTAPGGLGFSEGHFAYSGAPVSKVVIDFADGPDSFAFDNLVFVVPEPRSVGLLIAGAMVFFVLSSAKYGATN